jgi:hypothetical protein
VKSGGSGRSGIRDVPARIVDPVGVDFKPAEDFPADDVGYGFDNIGDVLSITPLLLLAFRWTPSPRIDLAANAYCFGQPVMCLVRWRLPVGRPAQPLDRKMKAAAKQRLQERC